MKSKLLTGMLIGLSTIGLNGCSGGETSGISPKLMADSLFSVMESDRTVYTKLIIQRLAGKEKVIKASEHWEDDKALVLPAQMFRYGAERVAEKGAAFSYSLLSSWPVNAQNKPKTDIEKTGLKFIEENPGMNYYGEEKLGDKTYYTAVYPDIAVSAACINCHNDHKDSPKTDFKLGEVMGGVVIRIPI